MTGAALLRSLLGMRRRRGYGPGEPAVSALFLHGRRDFAIEVRGAARHQAELHDIVSHRPLARLRQDCLVELVLEESAAAVAIVVEGQVVGHLPRHLATQYREWLQNWNLIGAQARCRGLIVNRTGGDPAGPRYGLRLDLEIPFKMTTLAF